MAVLWRHRDSAGNRYEVRQAGTSVRLYTNGVFHSQYNPRQPLAANVWSLLLLPALLNTSGRAERILVLGVGGGAVIRQLNDLVRPSLIVGVELNPVHLAVARRYFRAEAANVTLVQAEARDWLAAYRGPAFDVIIDDLFGDEDGEPCRALEADAHWCRALARHLTPTGRLVMNFDQPRALKRAAPVTDAHLKSFFAAGLSLSTKQYANQIGVFCLQRPDLSALENRLPSESRLTAGALPFRLQSLFG